MSRGGRGAPRLVPGHDTTLGDPGRLRRRGRAGIWSATIRAGTGARERGPGSPIVPIFHRRGTPCGYALWVKVSPSEPYDNPDHFRG